MHYDIALKELLRHCSRAILEHLVGLPVQESELLQVPQETTSVRRSDFPLRVVTADGEELLVLVELQARWERHLPLRLLEYRARHMRREDLDALTVVLLLRPGGKVVEEYADREVRYRYRVVRVYEADAREVVERGPVCLLPLVPLMRGGEALADEADRRIYESELDRATRADMLTVMAILGGLVSAELPRRLLQRRRDIMIESAAYELIKEEGRVEGLREGLEKGRAEGLREGLEKGRAPSPGQGRAEGLREGLEKGRAEGLREGILLGLELKFGVEEGLRAFKAVRRIEDVKLLEALYHALRDVDSVEAFERLVEHLAE